ncbi:MAG: outer membrane protein transport protein [Legionellales bacterium]|jgi:long-chain fatty acid transport protein
MYARILLWSCCFITTQSFAAGFYNDSQSVSAMGNAFAGAGAAGDDASMMFYNPATLTLIEDAQIVLAASYAIPDSTLTVTSAEDSFGHPIPNAAGQEYSAVPEQVIPAFYAAVPLNEQFVLGANITSPYFAQTEYPHDSVVNNTAIQNQFITYTGNLSLAMQATKKLTLAAGANLQYFSAKINANIFRENGNNVFFNEYEGHDLAFYPNFGLLYEFTENTRLGLNYRMQVKQTTSGDFSISGAGDHSVPATSTIYFPDMVSLNLFHMLNERIELLADVTFTHWDLLQNITVTTNEAPTDDASNTPINAEVAFINTWRVGLGANYYLTPEIKLRSGAAFDQSPVQDETRTLQGPDSNRVEVALGMMYKPKAWEKTHLDFAYMHTFFADGTVNQVNPLYALFPDSEFNGITASGYYNTSADFLGVQLVRII